MAFGMCAVIERTVCIPLIGKRKMLHALQELLNFIEEARRAHLQVANQ